MLLTKNDNRSSLNYPAAQYIAYLGIAFWVMLSLPCAIAGAVIEATDIGVTDTDGRAVDDVSVDNADISQEVSLYKIYKTARPGSPQQQAERAYHDALLAITRQQAPLAIQSLQGALDQYAQHHDARKLLVALLIKQDSLSLAEQILDIGLQLNPAQPEYYKLKGQLLMRQGKHDEAVWVLEQAIKTQMVDASYYALLAVGYNQAGSYQNAVEVYRRMLMDEPANALWWLGLALSLDAMNNVNDALEAYTNAVELNLPTEKVKLFAQQRITTLVSGSVKAEG